MFSYIRNLIKILFPSKKEEKIPAWKNPYPYNGDPENGDPVLSVMFTVTDKGVLLIDLENNTRQFRPLELASLISYIGSFRGQLDTLDVIKNGMLSSEQEKDHEEFLGHYVSLKTQEAADLENENKDQDTPCINPSDMLP